MIDTHTWAENWTGINGVPQEVATNYGAPGDGSHSITTPDGTLYKEFYGSGWQRGLTTQTEIWSGGVRQKWTVNNWTQDNTGVNYQTNPRVTETNVLDAGGNRRRGTFSYAPFTLPSGASCSLPTDTREYAGDASTVLRRSHVDYRMDATADAAYLNRHIIGLAKEQTLYEVNGGAETLMSRVSFGYDEAGSILGSDAPVSHDSSYDGNLVSGRANPSSLKRYDVMNSGQWTVSSVQYNTAGAVVSTTDPLSHHTAVSYADSFSDSNNGRNTLAYPTTATDADGYSSTLIYNFDFGAVTSKQTPQPNTTANLPGPVQTVSYDGAGRIERTTSTTNGAYTRYIYGPNYVQTFATVNTLADEAYSIQVFDGVGRVTLAASNHPGSSGGYSARNTIYDAMGRAVKQSNPTEVTSGWLPAGDDAWGWLYSQQTYDWKGRPLVTTNTDGTTKEASYAGCGCAGGEVVTLTDEGTIDGGVAKRRQQKIYSDVLGRTVKTEILNWQGGSPYATTINNYNARDQVTRVRQFDVGQGTVPSDPNDLSCPSGSCQQTTITYDGYGRLKNKHVPEQNENTYTTYNYNPDDTTSSVVDARGASSILTYNSRHLVTHVAFEPSAGVTDTPDVSLAYDAAGNRTSMTDGLGSVAYVYDQLSRLSSETRTFTGVGTFPLTYAYNLANEVTSVNDQTFSTSTGYGYDVAGRLLVVSGTGYPNVSQFTSNMQYRAWGGLKSMSYGNGKTLSMGYNSRLMPASYSVPGTISKTYQYYADGKLDYSQDMLDPRYDRKNQYDQIEHVSVALSGAEARGLGPTTDRPYNETYQHDAWGNTTNRTSLQWSNNFSDSSSQTYNNNRRNGWNYDAEGQFLNDATYNALQWKYDAAGQLTSITHPAFPTNPKRTDDYDGDGERLRSGYHQRGCSPEFSCPFEYTYYLRSTALGGQIISEIRGNGQKSMGYVYDTTGELIAVQKMATPEDVAAFIVWQHAEPAGLSVRATDTAGSSNGFIQSRFNAELDPVGASASLEDPGPLQLNEAPDETSPLFPGYGNLTKPSQGCIYRAASIMEYRCPIADGCSKTSMSLTCYYRKQHTPGEPIVGN